MGQSDRPRTSSTGSPSNDVGDATGTPSTLFSVSSETADRLTAGLVVTRAEARSTSCSHVPVQHHHRTIERDRTTALVRRSSSRNQVEVFGSILVNGQRIPIEVEALVGHSTSLKSRCSAAISINCLSRVVENVGALPADDEAVDTDTLGLSHVLAHDARLITRVTAECWEIDLRPVPTRRLEPDVVMREKERVIWGALTRRSVSGGGGGRWHENGHEDDQNTNNDATSLANHPHEVALWSSGGCATSASSCRCPLWDPGGLPPSSAGGWWNS